MGTREALYCLALAIGPLLIGCQSTGGGDNGAVEHTSWWDWGYKTPLSTVTAGSPFSAAATYNRNNTSDMGITLYDGTNRAKSCPPPASTPAASAGHWRGSARVS